MSLTGSVFVSLVVTSTIVGFVAVIILWPRLARSGFRRILGRSGLLLGVNLLVLLSAATLLNAQFLFFADWTDLRGALGGKASVTTLRRGETAQGAAHRTVVGRAATAASVLPPLPTGRVSSTGVIDYTVVGRLSRLKGEVMVQLPPGYLRSGDTTRYPVLETFQGYPSSPAQWIRTMNLGGTMTTAIAAHKIRAALIVSPQVEFPAGADTECVNGPAGSPQVETWLTEDVPNWVSHTFRVAVDRGSWATIGLSSGGWCAAMSAMLHPAQYSAAIVMGGYFRPEFGFAYRPFPVAGAQAARYDLVSLARRTPPPVALWLETSHADPVSYQSSAAFLQATRSPLAVAATILQNAGHRTGVWQGLLPDSLAWLGANAPGFAVTT